MRRRCASKRAVAVSAMGRGYVTGRGKHTLEGDVVCPLFKVVEEATEVMSPLEMFLFAVTSDLDRAKESSLLLAFDGCDLGGEELFP